jgi:hypothetical protein
VLAVVGAIIRAKVSNPARILRWLVPTVFVLLLIPDVDILYSDSQPGQQPRRRRRADAHARGRRRSLGGHRPDSSPAGSRPPVADGAVGSLEPGPVSGRQRVENPMSVMR